MQETPNLQVIILAASLAKSCIISCKNRASLCKKRDISRARAKQVLHARFLQDSCMILQVRFCWELSQVRAWPEGLHTYPEPPSPTATNSHNLPHNYCTHTHLRTTGFHKGYSCALYCKLYDTLTLPTRPIIICQKIVLGRQPVTLLALRLPEIITKWEWVYEKGCAEGCASWWLWGLVVPGFGC